MKKSGISSNSVFLFIFSRDISYDSNIVKINGKLSVPVFYYKNQLCKENHHLPQFNLRMSNRKIIQDWSKVHNSEMIYSQTCIKRLSLGQRKCGLVIKTGDLL